MSVSATVTLPAQPAIGSTATTALAGGGYVSPHSMTLTVVSVVEDASGGAASITVTFDTRWVSLVSWATVVESGTATTKQCLFSLRTEGGLGKEPGVVLPITAIVAGFSTQNTWCPPPHPTSVPVIGQVQPNFRIVTNNVDGDTLSLALCVYNFRKDVLDSVPLSVLVASLPRGTSGV